MTTLRAIVARVRHLTFCHTAKQRIARHLPVPKRDFNPSSEKYPFIRPLLTSFTHTIKMASKSRETTQPVLLLAFPARDATSLTIKEFQHLIQRSELRLLEVCEASPSQPTMRRCADS